MLVERLHGMGWDPGFCVIYPVDGTLWTSLLYKQEDTLGTEGMFSRAVGALCVELAQNTIFEIHLVSCSECQRMDFTQQAYTRGPKHAYGAWCSIVEAIR